MVLSFALCAASRAADYYVDFTSGIDAPGRGSQAEPWKTINYALDHISGSAGTPHRVLVARGTYTENVVCDAHESLYGGYNPPSWTRDVELYETTISGNDLDSAVVLAEGCTIDGFTVSHGSRDYGAGIHCSEINGTISNCRIRLNTASQRGSAIYVYGGEVNIVGNTMVNNTRDAVFVSSGTAILQNNMIADTASGNGLYADGSTVSCSGDHILRNQKRGMDVRGAGSLNAYRCVIGENHWSGLYHSVDATLIECLICRNDINVGMSGDFNGGGIHTGGGVLTLHRCVLCQNTSSYRGGALYKTSGACEVYDSILTANRSGWGHGCFLNGGSCTFKNNFVIDNGDIDINDLCHGGVPFTSVNNSVLYNDKGYDAYCLDPSEITMINDILWGNGDDIDFRNVHGDPVADQQTITYCDIEDGDLNGVNGNISVNPDFVGQIGSGALSGLSFDHDTCRSVLTDASASFETNALSRTFLWIGDRAFYVERNTRTQIWVYGDVTQVASVGYAYTVRDYHLIEGSLCIDVGTQTGALDHDFEGDPRPLNGGLALEVDMGADEFSNEPPPNDPPSQPGIIGTLAVAVQVPATDPEGWPVTYTARWESESGADVVHAGLTPIRGVLSDVLTETSLLQPNQLWTVTITPYDNVQPGTPTVVQVRSAGQERLYTEAELQAAVENAEAAKDTIIAERDGTIAALNATVAEMYTQQELDQAVTDANPDTDGDGFTDEQEIERETDPTRYVIVLKPGWNLVSLARIPEDNSVAGLFQGHVETEVWIWNEDQGRYQTTDEVVPLRGHWVYARHEVTIEIVLPSTVVAQLPEP